MPKLLKIRGFRPYISVVFLNAFVDLGHKIVLQNAIFKTYDGAQQIVLTAIVNALILLPFVLLFTPAGYCADKYAKNTVMRYSAWIAVGLTLLISLCYFLGAFWPAFAMTFFLAMQSAFYSPAKYGYIKELVGNADLTVANGAVQATTTVAILAGIFAFSALFEARLDGQLLTDKGAVLRQIAPIGGFLVLGSLFETLLAYRIPQHQQTDDSRRFDWRRYRRGDYLRKNLAVATRHETIFLSIVGLATFWAISQVLLAAFPAYAKATLGETNTVVIQGTLACSGIGIILGSLIASRFSKAHIETGMIPIGAFGVCACLFLLPTFDSAVLHGANFIALGFLGGLFVIPLNALIQFHAKENELGLILASSNLIQNATMLVFLGITAMFALYGLSDIQLFALLMLVALFGACYTLYKLPQALARFVVSAVIARRYRLEVLGFQHLPEAGGVLMLGNHISWIDWAIVQMACPRPVRFVMERSIYGRWYLKPFMDFFGVVPISAGYSKTALDSVRALLDAGEVVCLFPEGTISRTGQLSEFKSGYEKAAENATAVIVPFYLRGLWGSWFSRSSDRLRRQRSRGRKQDIIVAFGERLPIDTPAAELKKKIFELSIDSWQRHTESLQTLPAEWISSVKRMASEAAITDPLGGTLSNRRAITGAICLSRQIARLSPEQNVGLLMPTSAAGALVNMAVLLRGKTVVNLNYTASQDALRAAIDKADIRTVYTSSRFVDKLTKRGVELDQVFAAVTVQLLEDVSAGIRGWVKFATLALVTVLPAWLLRPLYCRRAELHAPAAILFSSGSEGVPKGVMLSHQNFMANIKQISDVLNMEDDDVIMASLPLFHAFGLTVTTFLPLIEGIPMVCHPDPTDVVNAAKSIAQHRVTIFCGTSTFLRLYTKNRRVHPLMLDSLRIVVAGAEKLSADVREAFKLKFNKDIYEGYGATETTPVASVNLPDQLDTRFWRVQQGGKSGTVGLALPGSSFRIVDPVTLAQLPTGEDGLILIGGTQVMLGYLKDTEKTAEVLFEMDGQRWYKSGDKGHVDADGFLTIVDRYSRFAKLAGEMVSLTAVEEQVRAALQDPELELAAVNVPDPKKGEQIVLLVVADIDADRLRKALLDMDCNALMIPSVVRQVSEIPKLGSGKTDFTATKTLAMAA